MFNALTFWSWLMESVCLMLLLAVGYWGQNLVDLIGIIGIDLRQHTQWLYLSTLLLTFLTWGVGLVFLYRKINNYMACREVPASSKIAN